MLCDDLMFTSKVATTARAQGLTVVALRTTAQVVSHARTSPPACVLVDLHNPDLDLPGLLAELRGVCPTMPRVVAYGSHVNKDLLQAAQTAGCDLVLPRSRFVASLEAELAAWLAPAQ